MSGLASCSQEAQPLLATIVGSEIGSDARAGAESSAGTATGRAGVALVPDPVEQAATVRLAPAELLLDHDEFGPQPCEAASLPEPTAWAVAFVQAALDVLAGRRPHRQLARWADPAVFTKIGLLAGQTAARRGVRRNPTRHVVRSVRVQHLGPGTIEAAVVVHCDRRARAVAVRLEALDGRWQCTAMQMA